MSEQRELFSTATGPAGFLVQQDFISRAEERALIAEIGKLPLQEARYKDYTARRRTVSFGFDYDFSYHTVHPAPPAPSFLDPIRKRVAAWLGVAFDDIRHVLIAEYSAGTALGWHRDVPNFELVCGVSLAASTRMRFRPFPPKGGNAVDRKRILSLELAPRSAYILRGDARWRWQHSIPPTKALRYSITFRTLA